MALFASRRALACLLFAFALSGCNESEPQSLTLAPVGASGAPAANVADPAPTPTTTPSPAPTVPADQVYDGPAEVNKYVAKFLNDGLAQGRTLKMTNPKLVIQIGSLDNYGSSVIGLCETGTNLRRVTFDPDYWNSASETQRELLVHHELGHCVLYRGHTTAVLSSGAYASIMYPIIMASSTYNNNYAYYQQELFALTSSALGGELALVDEEENHVHICGNGDL